MSTLMLPQLLYNLVFLALGSFLAGILAVAVTIFRNRYWLRMQILGADKRLSRWLDWVAPHVLFFAIWTFGYAVVSTTYSGWPAFVLFGFLGSTLLSQVGNLDRMISVVAQRLRETSIAILAPFSGRGQLILWIGAPVLVWMIVISTLGWWLGSGPDGFQWWQRSSWFSQTIEAKDISQVRADELRNLIGAVAVILGSLAAAMTLGNTIRRTALQDAERETNRDRLNSEAFFKASEQLASKDGSTRLAAIYSLEALAQQDSSLRKLLLRRIVETIAALLRERSANSAVQLPSGLPDRVEDEVVSVDVSAAMSVLVRSCPIFQRPHASTGNGINLRRLRAPRLKLPNRSDLRRLDLTASNLNRLQAEWADFSEAVLENATMEHASLRSANFRRADLSGANLQFAYIRNANFLGTQISNAKFLGAWMQGARISGASFCIYPEFNKAHLDQADLSGARIERGDFTECSLQLADLRSATFHKCNFSKVDLSGANITGTTFYKCDLSGAVLKPAAGVVTATRIKGISSAQFRDAYWNPATPPVWPEGFRPPHDGNWAQRETEGI